jgi:hypothetical protein
VPGAATVAGAGAVVRNLELKLVLAIADDHSGARRPGVLERVRQRLLHDPVGGEVDARRHVSRFTLDGNFDR